MENLYKKLGFEAPKVLVNPYGIKIYVGTEGKDDWAISIPKEIALQKINSDIAGVFSEQDYIQYLITEQQALSAAGKWTKFAREVML